MSISRDANENKSFSNRRSFNFAHSYISQEAILRRPVAATEQRFLLVLQPCSTTPRTITAAPQLQEFEKKSRYPIPLSNFRCSREATRSDSVQLPDGRRLAESGA